MPFLQKRRVAAETAALVCFILAQCIPVSFADELQNASCVSGECLLSNDSPDENAKVGVHFLDGDCVNWHESCSEWALGQAACLTNPGYMSYYCGESCGTCEYLTRAEEAFSKGENNGACLDHDFRCREWAIDGQCEEPEYLDFMLQNCQHACSLCDDDEVMTAVRRHANFTPPKPGDDIRDFLNPKLFENPETIDKIKAKLRAGKAVVIRNAFKLEYAEAIYQELISAENAFELHEYHDDDDNFACHHHNIYDRSKYTPLMDATINLFNSSATKAFVSDLSGRRCGGETWPSASWYKPGDHSLPHTDYHAGRTVAYVWHLTKNWKTVRNSVFCFFVFVFLLLIVWCLFCFFLIKLCRAGEVTCIG